MVSLHALYIGGAVKHPESFGDGRYAVIQLLGEGGMAFVYLAVDTRLGRAVAIKVPRPNLVDKANIIRRFAQETVTTARSTHPHVVTLYDAGAERFPDGTRTPYLVMELVAGVSVEDIFLHGKEKAFGPLPPRLASAVILGVLSALDDLHAGGLIHRDIKPSNIMVGWNPKLVKLMDFGIARMVQDAHDSDDRATKTAMVMFSPGYSAPEQQVSVKNATVRSDLYAVGATLYALLTGVQPEDLHNQNLDDPEFLAVPACLRAVVFGTTRYRPSERAYGSAREMADAVTNAVAREMEEREETFRSWLAARREVSEVEASLRRAFGYGYTIVPEAVEDVAAGFTRWFEESADAPSVVPPAGAAVAEVPAPALVPATDTFVEDPARENGRVSVRRRAWPWIAGGSVLALAAAGLIVLGARPDPSEVGAVQDGSVLSEPEASEPVVGETDVSVPPLAAPPVDPRVSSDSAPRTAPRMPKAALSVEEPVAVPVETVPELIVTVTEPAFTGGTVRLSGGAVSLSLIASDGTVYPSGRVPSGTYRLQAVFAEKGTAPNAGTVTVGANQTVMVVCQEMFKLCNAE